MSIGLPVTRLVNATINMTPLAAQFANFGILLAVGDSNVIDVNERIREYTTLTAVAADFGTTAPEYEVAVEVFSQSPKPNILKIGRWASTATSGLLNGGVLTAAQQDISLWNAVTTGSFKVTIDGVDKTLSGLTFASSLNLNAVASAISTALGSVGTCTWNGQYFTITSATTGVSSSVSYATTAGSGTDISAMLGMTAALASPPVLGIAAETALACTSLLDGLGASWYGLIFGTPTIQESDHLAIAAYVEASSNPHIYGVTSHATNILSSTVTTDIASKLKAGGYTRTFVQYGSQANKYPAASFFGRALTVNFQANNTTITMAYKQEPGITPENVTQPQAAVLESKRCNYFNYYNNGTRILYPGCMSGDAFFDEIHGLDWLVNQIQTNVWNLLYTNPTKIPQTDAGNNQLANAIEAACVVGVRNGLLAPGTWNGNSFGTLNTGDFLPKGYYVYAPAISTQAQSDREARKSVPFQVAVKLAGAVHTVDVIINVNR